MLAGFEALAQDPRVRRGSLWVDADNEAAVALYRSIGMATERINAEFERPQPKR